jgi:hypothetical protein
METMMVKAKKSKGKARMTPSRTQRKVPPAAARRAGSKAPAVARRPAKSARAAPSQPRSGIAVARRRGASIAVAGDDPVIALLGQLRDNLRAARLKLQSVQPNLLNDEESRAFTRQSHALDFAINSVRNAKLDVISARFAAELPAINKSTEQLNRDLQRLKDSVQIIRAIGSALGIIENIAKLLA